MTTRTIQSKNTYKGFHFGAGNNPASLSTEVLATVDQMERLAVDPTNPEVQDVGVWYNTTENVIKYWNGSAIREVGQINSEALEFLENSHLTLVGDELRIHLSGDATDYVTIDELVNTSQDVVNRYNFNAIDNQGGDTPTADTPVYAVERTDTLLDAKHNFAVIEDVTGVDPTVDTPVYAVDKADELFDTKVNFAVINNQGGATPTITTPIYSVDRTDTLLDAKYPFANIYTNSENGGGAVIGERVPNKAYVDTAIARASTDPVDITSLVYLDGEEVFTVIPQVGTQILLGSIDFVYDGPRPDLSNGDIITIGTATRYVVSGVVLKTGHFWVVQTQGGFPDQSGAVTITRITRTNEQGFSSVNFTGIPDDATTVALRDLTVDLTSLNNQVIDTSLIENSANTVESQVIQTALAGKLDLDGQNLDVDLTEDEQSTIRHRIDAAEPILRRTGGREIALLGADFSHPAITNETTLLITMEVASERDISLETFFQGGFVEIEDGSIPDLERVPYLVIASEAQGTNGILLTFGSPATLAASTGFSSELDLFAVDVEEVLEIEGGGSGHLVVIPSAGDFRTAVDLMYTTGEISFTYSDGTDTPVSVPLGATNTVVVDTGTGPHITAIGTVDGLTTLTQGTLTTDEVNEGSTNLFYTETRVDDRVQAGFDDPENIPQNGTVPTDWDDLGASIPSVGTGDNITGVTLDADANVTGVTLGTITGGGGGGGLDQYAVDTAYEVGDVVWLLADNKLYRTTTGHTSGATLADFNTSLWQELSTDGGVTSVTQNAVGGLDVVQDGMTTTLANEIILRNDHSTIWNVGGAPPNTLGATGSLAIDDSGSGVNTLYAKQSDGSWSTLPLDITTSPVAGLVTGISGTTVNFSAAATGNRLNIAGNGAGLVRYGNVTVEQPDNALSIRMASNGFFVGARGSVSSVAIGTGTHNSTAYTYQGLTLHFINGVALNTDGSDFITGSGVWSFTVTPLVSNSWTAFG